MKLNEIMEQLKTAGGGIQDAPWLVEDTQRKSRWDKYFAGEHSLEKDRVLDHYLVPLHEREIRRRQTEMLLDNTARELNALRRNPLHETTAMADVEVFTTQMLPIVRKIWPRLFQNEIFSTQPLKQPTAKIFTVDFKYGTSHSPYSTSSSLYPNEDADYSDDPGEAQEPNEIDFDISSETITAVSKKLKYVFNQEAAQDADSQYNVSLDNELLKMGGQQIEREINRKCIDAAESGATTNTNWTKTQPSSADPWANATPKQFAESLWDAVCDADQEIYERVYERGNIIVCGPTFATRLRKLNTFRKIDRTPGADVAVTGPNLFGTVNEVYKVFEDPFFTTSDKALVVHKNDNWMYTGAVYCPYVPLWSTPPIYNTKMQISRGLMSRYAKKIKNGDFFATVTVTT